MPHRPPAFSVCWLGLEPKGPKPCLFATKWVTFPPLGTSGLVFCAELRPGGRRGGPAPSILISFFRIWDIKHGQMNNVWNNKWTGIGAHGVQWVHALALGPSGLGDKTVHSAKGVGPSSSSGYCSLGVAVGVVSTGLELIAYRRLPMRPAPPTSTGQRLFRR